MFQWVLKGWTYTATDTSTRAHAGGITSRSHENCLFQENTEETKNAQPGENTAAFQKKDGAQPRVVQGRRGNKGAGVARRVS